MSATEKPELQSITPSLTVDDVGESLRWYSEVLGFEVAHRFEGDDGALVAASVKSGSCELFLGQDDWQKGRDRAKGVGFRLFCTTGQDLDALAAAIETRGGTLDQQPTDRHWGSRDFAITDPSGFKLTFTTPFGM